MPEITDQELAQAQKLQQLIQALTSNPEARAHFERAAKVLDPSVRTAEDQAAELAKPYVEKLEAMEKRWADREAQEVKDKEDRAQADALARLNSGFDRLKEAGVTDEGMEKIKALMTERTIPDPEAAFALFQSKNPPPPAETASYKPSGWDFEGDIMPNAKDWFTDPEGSEDRAIGQVLLEERKRSGGEG